ncbi:hypothetical protein F7734_45380 [Scytonema sp. UIC 10036]|uniref:hypothetical protein n=1 Tax=Scytonema sp. UIC 10036 TaxID=2304196 RepID=UPI0012DA5B7C|nr:hypothetical protein [Scytonema sp. UIC 10036]MUG99142.1 hypothetical protein [Scytonema sp. UIC 10036]
MVIGYWSLVIGYWSLVIGHWSFVIGHWSLEKMCAAKTNSLDPVQGVKGRSLCANIMKNVLNVLEI